MPSYKILSCDLDGTLFDYGTHVSEENDRAIRALVSGGALFVINTGRTYTEIPKELREHPAVQYIICSDGAAIYDQKNGTRISLCMENEVSNRVLDILADYECFPTVHYHGNSYLNADRFDRATMDYHNVNEYFRIHFELTNLPQTNFAEFCREADEVEMICTFFHSRKDLEEAAKRFEEAGLMVAATASYNIEVFSPRAGKGNALLRLAEHLGVAREDTIAMGDSTNDLSMIRAAGLGLAMENAKEAVKAEADAVACRNTEHIMPYLLKTYIR